MSAERVNLENWMWVALAILIVWILIGLVMRDKDPGDEGAVSL